MHFDTTLNLAWMLLGLCALASTARASFRTGSAASPKRLIHVVGVALIIAALFPYISATDDIVTIEHYNAQHGQQHPGKQSHNDDLIRLYETMDSPLVCRTSEVILTLSFAWLVFAPVLKRIDRSTPFIAGRSPPSLYIA